MRFVPTLILVLFLHSGIAMAAFFGNLLAGTTPSNLGVQAGQLAACPNSPNCVSSQAEDEGHRIVPLAFSGDAAEAMARLAQVVARQPGATIVTQRSDYLYATFQTRMMGFVDDVEFVANRAQNRIDVRSASRLGYGDFGVNRKRIEAVRAALAAEAG
jgi:uncharacterized protein (DUF1499 family)